MLITKLRKPLALVLVFLMFFSMVPFGYAAEMPASQFESGVDPPTEESLPEDEAPLTEPTITNSEPDPDSIPEDTIPETESAPETDSSEPSAEDVPQDGPGIMGLNAVLPHDTSLLGITDDSDLCTLITCTPIAVNSHRLLVTGHRIPFEAAREIVEEAQQEDAEVESAWEQEYLRGLYIALAIVLILFLICIVVALLGRNKDA